MICVPVREATIPCEPSVVLRTMSPATTPAAPKVAVGSVRTVAESAPVAEPVVRTTVAKVPVVRSTVARVPVVRTTVASGAARADHRGQGAARADHRGQGAARAEHARDGAARGGADRGRRVGCDEVAIDAAVAEAVVAVNRGAEVGVRGSLVGRVRAELDAHQGTLEAALVGADRQDLLVGRVDEWVAVNVPCEAVVA